VIFEPSEATEIVLQYKLHEKLNNGQIKNLSHEMVDNNESEEFPDISLHYALFNINQLLNKAFNGTFPRGKATTLEFELVLTNNQNTLISESIALQAISKLLRKQNLIVRLYEKEIAGKELFDEAKQIIWKLTKNEGNSYTLLTSDYWMNKEDFLDNEISDTITIYEE
jgi:hypothetical protein